MSGVIVQLKKFFTGQQMFPKTKTNAVYDDGGNRLDTILGGIVTKTNNLMKGDVVTSANADYAEVGTWYDENPNSENRLGKFVEIDTDTVGRTIEIATSTSDIVGVTVEHPAFSANASADKFDSNGDLLPKYAYVCLMGLATVYDGGLCSVKGRCMPNSQGNAIPSDNNMGYQVVERVDSTHILIAVAPNTDMVQRIKTDVAELQSHAVESDTAVEPTGEVGTRDADTLGGKYKATDIDKAITYDSDEEEEVEDVEIVDADRLGGKYTSEDIDNIKSDIDEIEDEIEELRNAPGLTAWKLFGHTSNQNELELPANYIELCIWIHYQTSTGDGTRGYYGGVVIPKLLIDSVGSAPFQWDNTNNSDNNGRCNFKITNNKIKLHTVYKDTTNQVANSTLYVYYR